MKKFLLLAVIALSLPFSHAFAEGKFYLDDPAKVASDATLYSLEVPYGSLNPIKIERDKMPFALPGNIPKYKSTGYEVSVNESIQCMPDGFTLHLLNGSSYTAHVMRNKDGSVSCKVTESKTPLPPTKR